MLSGKGLAVIQHCKAARYNRLMQPQCIGWSKSRPTWWSGHKKASFSVQKVPSVMGKSLKWPHNVAVTLALNTTFLADLCSASVEELLAWDMGWILQSIRKHHTSWSVREPNPTDSVPALSSGWRCDVRHQRSVWSKEKKSCNNSELRGECSLFASATEAI